MRRTAARGLTALLATAAVVAGVLPATSALAAPTDPTPINVGQLSQTQATNTNTNVTISVGQSSHNQVTGGQPPVIMFLTGPQTQPGTDPANSNAPYPAQKVFATGVTVTPDDNDFTVSTVSGHFNLAPGGNPVGPGYWDLTVCYGQSANSTSCTDSGPSVEKGTGIFYVFSPPPTVTGITPNTRASGSSQAVSVSGTGLSQGGTLSVEQNGNPHVGFTFGSYTYSGNATVTATMTISGEQAGTYDLRYTNTDGKTGLLPNALTVTPPVSLATNPISPVGVTKGVSNYPFTINGAQFQPGVQVKALDTSQSTAAAQAAGVTFTINTVTPTQITGVVSVLSNATPAGATASDPGFRKLVVTNPDNGSASLDNGFALYPVPTVTAVSPATRGRGYNGQLNITGTNFRTVGATNNPSPPIVNFGTGITHGVVHWNSATSLTVDDVLIAQDAPLGARAITVRNPDGADVSSGSSALTITASPSVGTVSPSRSARGRTVSITVTGSGYSTATNGMTLAIINPTSGGTVCTSNPTTATSATKLTASCTIPGGTAPGEYGIRLTNTGDGGTSDCAGTCFSIDSFGVDSVTTQAGGVGNNDPSIVPVTVTGGGIPQGAHITLRHNPSLFDQAELQREPCPTAAVPSCGGVAQDGSSITEYFKFLDVAPGLYDVIVTGVVNGNNTVGQCTCQINVNAAGSPTVTTISPTTFVQGTMAKTVTITGTNFYPGDRAVISGGDGKVVVVAGSEQTAADHKSMTFKVTVDPAAATGTANSVKIVDSSSPAFSSGSTQLTINPAPVIKTVAPTTVGQGGTTASDGFTVTGTSFVVGADKPSSTQFTACTGVTIDPTTVVITKGVSGADDTAKMKLSVASDTATGPCAITATNPDTGTNTAASLLSITAAPVATQVSPKALGRGATSQDLTITGTGFAAGVTVAFLRNNAADTGTTVNTVTVNSATQLTVNVTTAANAVVGKRDIKFTNTDLGTSTCANCFSVATVPGVVSNVTAKPGDGKALVSWTAPTDDGGDAVVSYDIVVNPGARHVASPGTGTSRVVTGLTNGTAYTFSVSAKNTIPGAGTPVGTTEAVTPSPVARFVNMKPVLVVNSSTGLGIPNATRGRVANRTFDVQLANVPTNAVGATFVAALSSASAATNVSVYGTGQPAGPVTAYAYPTINKSGTAVVNFGPTPGKVRIAVSGNGAYMTLHQTGWLIRGDADGATPATTGGVYVPMNANLVEASTSNSTTPLSNAVYYRTPDLQSAEAVALQVTALNVRSNGRVFAYAPEDGAITGMTFMSGKATTQLLITRLGQGTAKCTSDPAESASINRLCIKVQGISGVRVQLVGYWSKKTSDLSGFGSRVASIAPTRIFTATTTRVGEMTMKVPSSVPSTASAVLVQVRAYYSPSGYTFVKLYADGADEPAEFAATTSRYDVASNLAVASFNPTTRNLRLKVIGPGVKLYVDVIGYIN